MRFATRGKRVDVSFERGLEIQAVGGAVVKSLSKVAQVWAWPRMFAAEVDLRDAFVAGTDHLEESPLVVSLPARRLPHLLGALAHRAGTLAELAEVRDSSDPRFYRAYGADLYLPIAHAAVYAVAVLAAQQPGAGRPEQGEPPAPFDPAI